MRITKSIVINTTLASIVAISIPTVANAHIANETSFGLVHGFTHPASGLDHILMIVGVGIIAFMLGGLSKFWLPATFVVSMLVGSFVGFSGIEFGHVEQAIIISNIILGLILLFAIRLDDLIIYLCVSIFAMFHGYAHGVEIPKDVNGITYVIGFVICTILLHSIGLCIGLMNEKIKLKNEKLFLRSSGAVVLIASTLALF